MSAPRITTVLVANRGEIACRVMRTAKAMGLTTVAVHSATDRQARHSREADICVDLGGSKAADSYLQIDKLIAAAEKELGPETTVLVQGSRFMKMERVADALAAEETR